MNMITRRRALGITAGAVTAIGAAAAVVVVRSSDKSPGAPSDAKPEAKASTPAGSLPVAAIDEVYEGRRIQISLGEGGHHSPGLPTIKIDGKELHLMRNADGSWLTVVNHYETFPDPISAARAAVRDLQGAALIPFGPSGGTS
ncbi:tyrosinase cofactor [Streptomyces sp. NBC_00249]|uniref:apotyrosinase chaperone MelC1 n=1 Tax=Streptomyces sp. NBC_00249 TaxID=2975690 RepID=UPI002258CAE1|nr:tyrosinase cofactor [Streptomyces sp. NBC_00249]MCX5195545.1 tyrosinase cofactor [Streptomyces sp. NBC_00249]